MEIDDFSYLVSGVDLVAVFDARSFSGALGDPLTIVIESICPLLISILHHLAIWYITHGAQTVPGRLGDAAISHNSVPHF
jgi:hypothetical protein